MKKMVLLVFGLVFCVSNVFAGQMYSQNIVASNGSTTFLIAKSGTQYSKAFPIKSGEYFGISYKATSVTGTPNINLELEQSYELPTTEGASDTEWVEPDNASDIATAITTDYRGISRLPLYPGDLPDIGAIERKKNYPVYTGQSYGEWNASITEFRNSQ